MISHDLSHKITNRCPSDSVNSSRNSTPRMSFGTLCSCPPLSPGAHDAWNCLQESKISIRNIRLCGLTCNTIESGPGCLTAELRQNPVAICHGLCFSDVCEKHSSVLTGRLKTTVRVVLDATSTDEDIYLMTVKTPYSGDHKDRVVARRSLHLLRLLRLLHLLIVVC